MNGWLVAGVALLAAVIGLSVWGFKKGLPRTQIRLLILVPAMSLGAVLAANQARLKFFFASSNNPCVTVFEEEPLLAGPESEPWAFKTSMMCEMRRGGRDLNVQIANAGSSDTYAQTLIDAEHESRQVSPVAGTPAAAIVNNRAGDGELFIALDAEGSYLRVSGTTGTDLSTLAAHLRPQVPVFSQWIAEQRKR